MKKIAIILGLLLILCSAACGMCIVIFSFKFMGGNWLSLGKYILAVLGLGLGGMFIGLTGINIIMKIVSNYGDINE